MIAMQLSHQPISTAAPTPYCLKCGTLLTEDNHRYRDPFCLPCRNQAVEAAEVVQAMEAAEAKRLWEQRKRDELDQPSFSEEYPCTIGIGLARGSREHGLLRRQKREG